MILNRTIFLLIALLAVTLMSHGLVIPKDELESDCARDTDFAQDGIDNLSPIILHIQHWEMQGSLLREFPSGLRS
ncbi:uncharacterized protein ARMOST_13546 [Armillaria ostoyae]|uniref:Uncharacterized protein n=1 Tax=Armillaria ostoyae TaxID=47428 RepID=A0A284RN15_ARMOS|nr:uncharacterized protein ARMOST_13546 [Armillaria ostoyae]